MAQVPLSQRVVALIFLLGVTFISIEYIQQEEGGYTPWSTNTVVVPTHSNREWSARMFPSTPLIEYDEVTSPNTIRACGQLKMLNSAAVDDSNVSRSHSFIRSFEFIEPPFRRERYWLCLPICFASRNVLNFCVRVHCYSTVHFDRSP